MSYATGNVPYQRAREEPYLRKSTGCKWLNEPKASASSDSGYIFLSNVATDNLIVSVSDESIIDRIIRPDLSYKVCLQRSSIEA